MTEPTIESLLEKQIDTLSADINRRLDATERNLNRRLDDQDRALRDIKTQTTATNGRVGVLERARERAQGVMFAFKWLPQVLTAVLSTGLTILVLALTGGIR